MHSSQPEIYTYQQEYRPYAPVATREPDIELPPVPPPSYSSAFPPDTVDTRDTPNGFLPNISLPDWMSEKACAGIVGIAVGIVLLLILILLPISFVGLEYYEMGFKRSKSTGSVDVENVYLVGKHFIGPDREFKIFPADAQFERFVGVTVFSADRLEMEITCTMMYFLRPHQLKELHRKFDVHYKPVLRNNALDSLKGAATLFSTREFIREREKVEKRLYKAVRERLGGKCCEKDCGVKKNCVEGCIPYSNCDVEFDYGLYAEVRYFQLGGIGIPDELNQRFLKALVLQEENETEKLKQESQVIRKETQAQVQRIHNEASEITQNATAQSNLIQSKAKASSVATVENARSEGLKHLYSEIGITDQKQKAAFDYLRTIRAQENIRLTVNYNQLVSFTGNANLK